LVSCLGVPFPFGPLNFPPGLLCKQGKWFFLSNYFADYVARNVGDYIYKQRHGEMDISGIMSSSVAKSAVSSSSGSPLGRNSLQANDDDDVSSILGIEMSLELRHENLTNG
jgi:hypothetical protein